jgi:hypothetical protein
MRLDLFQFKKIWSGFYDVLKNSVSHFDTLPNEKRKHGVGNESSIGCKHLSIFSLRLFVDARTIGERVAKSSEKREC